MTHKGFCPILSPKKCKLHQLNFVAFTLVFQWYVRIPNHRSARTSFLAGWMALPVGAALTYLYWHQVCRQDSNMVSETHALAVPFYRGKALLKKCLESVFSQTDPLWTLTVFDDGGLESGVEELVRSFGDPRLKYVRNPTNLGLAGNWNRGLREATGDLVTLLHADDELLPSYVAVLRKRAAEFPEASFIFCRSQTINEDSRRVFSLTDTYKDRFLLPSRTEPFFLEGEAGVRALLHGNFIICPSICYRRSRLQGEFFSEDWVYLTDFEFSLRLLLKGHRLLGIPEIAFLYRRHASNFTLHGFANDRFFEEESRLFDLIANEAGRHGWKETGKLARSKGILKKRLLFGALVDASTGRWAEAWKKWSLLREK